MAYKYDLSGSSYIRKMEEKESQYNGLVRKAERINYDLGGKPSKEEAVFYLQAAKVGEEIMNMNLSERAVYSLWKMRVMDCEAQAKRITDIIAPKPQPQPEPQKEPVRSGYVPKSDGPVKSTTSSGFKTNNACADVKAETIEKWYKDAPNHDFSKVSGMEDLKKQLMDEAASIGWTETDDALNISPVQSYFFYGPPGTGKTYLIEAFAAELMKNGFKFIQLMGGDIHASLVGVAEKTVQIAFQEAVDNAPCLIFIDEIENVCVGRGGSQAQGHEKRLTVAFLEAYNKLKSSGKRVIFMGATNHPGMVDEAMLDRITLVKIPLPTENARKAYFERELGVLGLEPGFTAEDIAAVTDNYSYRDLGRLKDTLAVRVKSRGIQEFAVLDAEGKLDKAETDKRVSEAIKNQELLLDRELFDQVRKELPPSDKSKIREELKAFEENVRRLNG